MSRSVLIIPLLVAWIIPFSSATMTFCSSDKQITFHCTEGECNNSLNSTEDSHHDIAVDSDEIPENSTVNEVEPENLSETEKRMANYQNSEYIRVEKTESPELPGYKEYLKLDKSPCPMSMKLHAYPKSEFDKAELQDRESCYETTVESTENYHIVYRVGDTSPNHCTETSTCTAGCMPGTPSVSQEYVKDQSTGLSLVSLRPITEPLILVYELLS